MSLLDVETFRPVALRACEYSWGRRVQKNDRVYGSINVNDRPYP